MITNHLGEMRQTLPEEKNTIRSQIPLATLEMVRPDDVFAVGGTPALICKCVCRVTLCHSSLGDANRVAEGTTNTRPLPALHESM